MRIIIDKYIELLIDNEREFSLEDFIEIFKVSLCAREIDNCQNERINLPLHSCFLCSYQVIEDISPYLCNHTLTLFKVLYVLSNFADIKSHKKIFTDMYNKIRRNKERLLLINLYFQYRTTADRFETNSNIPNSLRLFYKKAINQFDFLENVYKSTTLEYFFMVGIPATAWCTVRAKCHEVNSRIEYKLIKAYWNKYARILSTLVNTKVIKEVKVLNRNHQNLIVISKISFFINPIQYPINKNN
jgi:hypothetical protein